MDEANVETTKKEISHGSALNSTCMRSVFGYNLRLLGGFLLLVVILIVYSLWRERQVEVADVVIVLVVVGFSAIMWLTTIARVLVDDSTIEVKFLLPLGRGGVFGCADIKRYTPLRYPRRPEVAPVAGLLVPQEGKQIFLWSMGTKEFAKLSGVLSKLVAAARRRSKEIEPARIPPAPWENYRDDHRTVRRWTSSDGDYCVYIVRRPDGLFGHWTERFDHDYSYPSWIPEYTGGSFFDNEEAAEVALAETNSWIRQTKPDLPVDSE
ncbi:MAG: hypothetical protein AAF591_00515 [Verrucomicrobiota bacterium]